MEYRDIGLRAQDIQTGLQEVDLRGPASGSLDTTLLVGMAERLAVHVRGVEIISDEQRLLLVADRLGINTLVLPQVLELLEEAEFINVERRGQHFRRLIDRVPYFSDVYSQLGEIWASRGPGETETATIEILHRLAKAPEKRSQLRNDYGLSDVEFTVLLEVGKEGGYVDEFTSHTDSSSVLFSPLYWEELGEETFRLLERYGANRILSAIRTVEKRQGMPIPDLSVDSSQSDRIVFEAMAVGLLPSPEINSVNGPKRFAFTPYRGQITLDIDERPILQKARAILACVRYGQHFGGVTKIRNPAALLDALVKTGRLSPHSEIPQQYATLVVEGIARVSPAATSSDRYVLQIIDTPENNRALRIAVDMLTVGEALADRGLDESARKALFSAGSIKEPITARSDLIRHRRQTKLPENVLRKQVERLVDDIRQV